MDELLDILDATGAFTGKTAMKSVAHQEGLFHQTVHIWFYTKKGALLVQQRGKSKDTYPLLWDTSVAGHIGAGESIEISALREIQEEIGIQVSKNSLEKIGVFKSIQKHQKDLIDCEFHHTFICELKVPLEQLTKQESEVEALCLIPLHSFKMEVNNKNTSQKYVPHNVSYYNTIIKEISRRL